MNLIFIVDTSASMRQLGPDNMSYLDTVKMAVLSFARNRAQTKGQSERYSLVSYEPGLDAIKSWNQPFPFLEVGLKQLEAVDFRDPTQAVKTVLELIHVTRMQGDADNYSQGRLPWSLTPSCIIHIGHQSPLISRSGLPVKFEMTFDNKPGWNLTREPFRWDTIMNSIGLSLDVGATISGADGRIPCGPDAPLKSMCDVMAGQACQVTTVKALTKCLEAYGSKVQPQIVLSVEPLRQHVPSKPEAPKEAMPSSRSQLLLVKPNAKGKWAGTWVIPEQFVPSNDQALPPRTAAPRIKVDPKPTVPIVVEGLPFDKYELVPSPLTKWILSWRHTNLCFPCFVDGSSPSGESCPFGYLKPASTGRTVNLVVLPFNYPVLHSLMAKLVKAHYRPQPDWLARFHDYLSKIPQYYHAALRNALKVHRTLDLPLVMPMDTFPGRPLPGHQALLSRYKFACRQEAQSVFAHVQKQQATNFVAKSVGLSDRDKTEQAESSRPESRRETEHAGQVKAQTLRSMLHEGLASGNELKQDWNTSQLDPTPSDEEPVTQHQPLLNFLHVQRRDLVAAVYRGRNLLQRARAGLAREPVATAERCAIPIAQMGNYSQAFQKQRRLMLRSPTPEEDETKHPLFGNPYRAASSKQSGMLDDAEVVTDRMPLLDQRSSKKKPSAAVPQRSRPPKPPSSKHPKHARPPKPSATPVPDHTPHRTASHPGPSTLASHTPLAKVPPPPPPKAPKLKRVASTPPTGESNKRAASLAATPELPPGRTSSAPSRLEQPPAAKRVKPSPTSGTKPSATSSSKPSKSATGFSEAGWRQQCFRHLRAKASLKDFKELVLQMPEDHPTRASDLRRMKQLAHKSEYGEALLWLQSLHVEDDD